MNETLKDRAKKIIKEKGLSSLHKDLIFSSQSYEEYRQRFVLIKPQLVQIGECGQPVDYVEYFIMRRYWIK